jgi:hypothetical protein
MSVMAFHLQAIWRGVSRETCVAFIWSVRAVVLPPATNASYPMHCWGIITEKGDVSAGPEVADFLHNQE